MMGEKLVLTMDGSTSVCCAALLVEHHDPREGEEKVVARRVEKNRRGQARILLRQVDEMLDEVGAEPRELAKIVVGVGPGTFTGVRIAVATARGLSLGLGVPVFGVSTLSSLAAWALDTSSEEERSSWTRVVPVVDARRSQVFFAEYEGQETGGGVAGGSWARVRPVRACDRESLAETLAGSGDGMTAVVGDDEVMIVASDQHVRQLKSEVRAEYLVLGQERLGERSKRDEDATDGENEAGDLTEGSPERVKPIYVRAPDADVHIVKMRDPWA